MTHRKQNKIGNDKTQHLSLPPSNSNLSEQNSFRDKQKTLFTRLKKLRKNATYSELVFMRKLEALNIKFIFQKGFIKGDYYCIVDFYLPKPLMVCIEVDGLYHKNHNQKIKDFYRDKYLKSRNFKVIRITNEDAERLSLKELKNLL